MDEDKRLIELLGPGLERDLLLRGSQETAPAEARKRLGATLLGAGAVTPLFARPEVGLAGGSSASAGGSSLLVTLAKWIAVGALAGGATSVGTVALTPSDPEAARSEIRQPAPAVEQAPPAPTRAAARPDSPPAVSAKPPKAEPARGAVVIDTAALSPEAQSLEHVRWVAEKDPARGLDLLAAHEARFPHGARAEETRALRARLRAEASR